MVVPDDGRHRRLAQGRPWWRVSSPSVPTPSPTEGRQWVAFIFFGRGAPAGRSPPSGQPRASLATSPTTRTRTRSELPGR